MSFLKKNPLFCAVVALSLAACLAGLYFTFNASGKVQNARASLQTAEAQLDSLLRADPAPTEANLEAAQSNLNSLRTKLTEIRDDLQQGASLDTSRDGVSVLAGIQQYVAKFQRATANHRNEADEPEPIETPNDFAFGFPQYIREAAVPEDPDQVSRLDKQRQILSYLMTQLIEASPQSIATVQREILEVSEDSEGGKKGFSIDPAISARVPGAIDTMAFRLTFTGYTDALREFLNSLATFELPIVVRSIEVERPGGSETLVAPTRRNDPESIFDLFAEEEAPTEAAQSERAAEEQKPVIEENISEFTVILEFIELILPDTQNQEAPDPA
jgi:hypothetical protein